MSATGEFSLWVYYPNQGAVIFFIVGYFTTMMWHLWQCRQYKCFKFTWLLPASGACFILGYVLRALGAFGMQDQLIVYILSLIFVAVVPPLLALVNYNIFGHLLYYVPYLAPMPPNAVLYVFGIMSLLIETLNGIGAAIGSNPEGSAAAMGESFMRASLALQLILNTIFLVMVVLFHWRCSRAGIVKAPNVAWPLGALYASVILMLTRTVFRTIEHLGMEDLNRLDPASAAPVVKYEWYFLVFESTLMLVDMLLWNVLHPRKYLPKELNVYLARDGVREVSGPILHDPRSRVYRMLDPLDFLKKNKDGRKVWQNIEEREGHEMGQGGQAVGRV